MESYLQALYLGLLRATEGFSHSCRQAYRAAPIRITAFEHSVTPPLWAVLDQRLCAVTAQLSGDLFGSIALIFTDEDAARAGRRLLEGLPRPQTAGGGRDIAASAIEEMGNMFLNSSLAPLANQHGLMIFTSAPDLLRGSFERIWRQLTVPQAGAQEIVLLYSDITPARREEKSEAVSRGLFALCLSRDSLARLASAASGEAPKNIEVGMGEIKTAQAPTVLKATSLGSCLAVILYDEVRKKASMAHVVLPQAPKAPPAALPGAYAPGKFADTAVAELVKNLGAPTVHWRAWLVGGANMFPGVKGGRAFQIGNQNVEVARRRLKAAGIGKIAEEVGGNRGRTVEFHTDSGEAWMRCGFVPRQVKLPG